MNKKTKLTKRFTPWFSVQERRKTRGFTLVELLVTIAIIGILSATILVSLGGARDKARLARTQSQMSSLHPYLIMCINDDLAVNFSITAPVAGNSICTGSIGTFAQLPSNWNYAVSAVGSYKATGEGKNIVCTETGCVTSDTP